MYNTLGNACKRWEMQIYQGKAKDWESDPGRNII